MAHNQEMLEKNHEKWQGKVRIVGLSVDEEKDDVIKRVEEKKWNKVDHYLLDKSNPNAKYYSQIYGAQGIPRIVVVNKHGKIVFLGHPSSVDLEKVLNDLLEASEDIVPESAKSKDAPKTSSSSGSKELLEKIEFNEFKKQRNLLLSAINKVRSGINYTAQTTMSDSCCYTFENSNIVKKLKEVNISSLQLRKKDMDLLNESLNKEVYPHINKDLFGFNIELMETINVVKGTKCHKCSNDITNENQYYCHVCKVHYCFTCGDKVDESKKGMERLVEIHDLIMIPALVNSNEMTEVDVERLGKSKSSLNSEISSQNHYASCNCCDGSVGGGVRYVCLNCRPGFCRNFTDYCQPCMAVMLDPKNEKHETFKKKNKDKDNHLMSSHIYLRLWFSNDTYWDY